MYKLNLYIIPAANTRAIRLPGRSQIDIGALYDMRISAWTDDVVACFVADPSLINRSIIAETIAESAMIQRCRCTSVEVASLTLSEEEMPTRGRADHMRVNVYIIS